MSASSCQAREDGDMNDKDTVPDLEIAASDEQTDAVEIRPAAPGDMTAVAELRWRWSSELGETAAMKREEFVEHFVAWTRQHTSSHLCLVMARGATVIGMAFLAIQPRVPSPRFPERTVGDLQCVYVAPEERDGGRGGELVDALVTRARERGVERLTVHASLRAIAMYRRHGFDLAPQLLQADGARSSGSTR